MQLKILVFSAPPTALALHGAVDTKDADPISKLPIKECRKSLIFAYGAGLLHGLNASDAGLAEVSSTAAGQVRVAHHREADGTTTVVWGLLNKANIESSPASWSGIHHHTQLRII